jgi:hypothetical protein
VQRSFALEVNGPLVRLGKPSKDVEVRRPALSPELGARGEPDRNREEGVAKAIHHAREHDLVADGRMGVSINGLSDSGGDACLLAEHLRDRKASVRRLDDVGSDAEGDIECVLALRDHLFHAFGRVYLEPDCVNPVDEVLGEPDQGLAGSVDAHHDELGVGHLLVGQRLQIVGHLSADVVVEPVEVVDDDGPDRLHARKLGDHLPVLCFACAELEYFVLESELR